MFCESPIVIVNGVDFALKTKLPSDPVKFGATTKVVVLVTVVIILAVILLFGL